MYITGGIGSAGSNEGFSVDYDLPNEQAYCETCASVGMVFWNQRMNALTGDAEYADILERSLYNGALDGLSLSGDRFFYGNPLASSGKNARREWFGTACCPSNIARLVASIGNYIYASSDDGIWVNLFVGNNSSIRVKETDIAISLQTEYPWEGKVNIKVDPAKKIKTSLFIRVPGWARGTAVPGDLYHFTDKSWEKPTLTVNGKAYEYDIEKGYAVINREWKKGDIVEFSVPMPVKTIVSRKEVAENEGKIAIQRGPLVYCIEGADNQGKALNIIADGEVRLIPEKGTVLDEKVLTLKGPMTTVVIRDGGTSIATEKQTVTAIPYYTWCNRGSNEMQVWLPTYVKSIRVTSK
jgi:hypothetical protein